MNNIPACLVRLGERRYKRKDVFVSLGAGFVGGALLVGLFAGIYCGIISTIVVLDYAKYLLGV
jgi:hypothetical protein